jgi:peptidoglycan/LPS O-acetylase OafA/YrhL
MSPAPRRDIQGLRAVAVLAVVCAHALGWPQGGFVGVDVFFVVSGFLITGLLLREFARDGRISLRAFYARRVRRILPASLLVLIVVTITGFLVFNRARADQTLGDAVAAALLVSNWRFAAQGTDYFHAADAVSPLQHFWTLSVEEQFYLVWPGLLVVAVLLASALLGRRAQRNRPGAVVGGVALLVVGASLGWAAVQSAADPNVAYFSTATRVWELAAGAVVAVVAPRLARMPAGPRWALGWVGLAGVLWSFLVIDPDAMVFPFPWALLPVASTVLILVGGVGGDPRQRYLFPLTNPVSVFIGDMSYSLYLWHFPVIVFAAVLLPTTDEAIFLTLFVIALLSVTTFFMLEQPIHRSPWMSGRAAKHRAGDGTSPPAAPAAPAVSTAAPLAAQTLSSRPAGWTPGTRYYPGARPRVSRPVTAADPPASTGAVAPVLVVSDMAAVPASGPADPSGWAAWRARYSAQIGISTAALGIGAAVVVLVVQISSGPFTLDSRVSESSAVVEPGNAGAAVQTELSAAIAATSWPVLTPSLDEVIARSSSDNPARNCFQPEVVPDPKACTWGDPDAPRHMYLVGDSSAMAYAPALKAIAETSEGAWQITTVGMYGCRFTDVLVDNSDSAVMAACPQRKDDVRQMIALAPADLVLVSNAYTLGHTSDGRDLSADDLMVAAQAEVGSYGAAGGVVYLSPPPHGQDLGRCYSPLTAPSACLSAVESTWHDMQGAASTVAASTGGHVIDSLPFSCVDDVCPAFAGRLPIRYDETHLTVAYAQRIAPVLHADLVALGLF